MQTEEEVPPIITVKGLRKTFDNVHDVLKDISVTVPRGEIFVIIGPSGAGKTTLLRLLDLLESPSSGTISFDGIETSPLRTGPAVSPAPYRHGVPKYIAF